MTGAGNRRKTLLSPYVLPATSQCLLVAELNRKPAGKRKSGKGCWLRALTPQRRVAWAQETADKQHNLQVSYTGLFLFCLCPPSLSNPMHSHGFYHISVDNAQIQAPCLTSFISLAFLTAFLTTPFRRLPFISKSLYQLVEFIFSIKLVSSLLPISVGNATIVPGFMFGSSVSFLSCQST